MASARDKKKNGEDTAVPVDETGPVMHPQGRVIHGLDGARHRRSIKKAAEDIRGVMEVVGALIEREVFPFHWHLTELVPDPRPDVREAVALRLLFEAWLSLIYKTGTPIEVVRGWIDEGWATLEKQLGPQVVGGKFAASVLRSDVACPACDHPNVRKHLIDVLGTFYRCPCCDAFWEVPKENNL